MDAPGQKHRQFDASIIFGIALVLVALLLSGYVLLHYL